MGALVVAGDRLDDLQGVGHLRVDLARICVTLEVGANLRERTPALGQHLEHHQGGDRPGIRPVVVPEVVVAGVFATEHGVGFRHDRLDIGVTEPGCGPEPAALPDDLRHRFRADQVVQDGGTGMLGQHGRRDQGGRRRAGHRDPLVVDKEAPVGVAVERQPDVGAGVEDPLAQGHQVFGLDGVGGMIGEGPVQFSEEDLELEWQACEHGRTTRPPMPLAVSATTLRGLRAGRETKDRTLAA